MEFETVIGLEVHAQLKTKSKMFCRCSAEYADALPNTHVCPVCLGMPGVLPVINKQAVEHTIMTALALGCKISEYTKFDRKNYPYPDLMKGYQISQYDAPFGYDGCLTIEVDGEEKEIGITRVHLEEDVSKLLHRVSPDGEPYSLVDVNRSGVPLMEVVGEPDLRSPEEARQYLMALRNILRYLDVSTANMEEGSFRCDANISIRPEGSSEFLTKVEIKNMNSFRAVYRALEFEAKRQIKAASEGRKLEQETRGWVEDKGITVPQRSKEYAHDYRYFPEPDLPPLILSQNQIEEIKAELPELPDARRKRFVEEYDLPVYDANHMTDSKEMASHFEELVKRGITPKDASNALLGPISTIMNTHNISIDEYFQKTKYERVFSLSKLHQQNVVNTTTYRSMFEEMYKTGKDPDTLLKEGERSQISDIDKIEEAVSQAISANTQAVADFKAGKEAALKFLVGQVMKATKGRANPQLVSMLVEKKLEGE